MRSILFIMLSLLLLLGVGVGAPKVYRYYERSQFPVIGQAPHFQLQSVNGSSFDSNSMKGKVWLASFFFTSCQATCPTLFGELARMRNRFADQSDFEIVSITVDPTYDSPDVLAEYVKKRSINTNRWHLLTGSKEDVEKTVVDGFQIGSRQDPLMHSNRFLLVDQEGNIRGSYTGTNPEDVAQLEADLPKFLK